MPVGLKLHQECSNIPDGLIGQQDKDTLNAIADSLQTVCEAGKEGRLGHSKRQGRRSRDRETSLWSCTDCDAALNSTAEMSSVVLQCTSTYASVTAVSAMSGVQW